MAGPSPLVHCDAIMWCGNCALFIARPSPPVPKAVPQLSNSRNQVMQLLEMHPSIMERRLLEMHQRCGNFDLTLWDSSCSSSFSESETESNSSAALTSGTSGTMGHLLRPPPVLKPPCNCPPHTQAFWIREAIFDELAPAEPSQASLCQPGSCNHHRPPLLQLPGLR